MRSLLAAVLALSLAPSAGAATVTIGRETISTSGSFIGCSTACDYTSVQTALQNPGVVASPGDGAVVGWRMIGTRSSDSTWMCPLVVHPEAGGKYSAGARPGATSSACGSGTPTALDGSVNQLTVPLAIQAGDLIGVDFHSPGSTTMWLYTVTGLASASIAQFTPTLAAAATAPTNTAATELMANFDVQLAAPGISQLTPGAGDGGTQVTITGQHLANATGVMFGSVAGTITSNTNTQIVAVAPPGNQGPVDVTVTTMGGSATGTFTYPVPAPPPAADTTAPVLSSLALTPRKFRAANIGGSIAVAVGGRMRYSVSEAGTVTFTVQRLVSGHRRAGRCRAGGHTGRRCTVVQKIKGSFGRTRAAAGQDQFRFTARVGGRSLKPGRYRLTAKAKDAAGNASTASTATFTIVK